MRLLLAGLLLICALPVSATTSVQPALTGAWFDPARNGQGLIFDVVNGSNGRELVAYWFTFDGAGAQRWALAQAQPIGNRVSLSFLRAEGPRFMQPAPGNQPALQPFGNGELEFLTCDTARFSYTTPLGNGTVDLVRLTRIEGQSCGSSVLLDWTPTTVAEAQTAMTGAGGASGSLDLQTRPGQVSFEVEVEDVPAGSYRVFVAGIERATLQAVSQNGRIKGQVEFKAPVEPGKLPLEFDPRGRRVEVRRADQSVLVSGTAPVL